MRMQQRMSSSYTRLIELRSSRKTKDRLCVRTCLFCTQTNKKIWILSEKKIRSSLMGGPLSLVLILLQIMLKICYSYYDKNAVFVMLHVCVVM